MSIFRFTRNSIEPVASVSFPEIGWEERKHFQGLLRDHIDVIVPGGLVVSEEYCNWDEGKRRIDLLVVDRERNLVVVELKRTDDGGHMELQALRYAAMISRMTFEGLVGAFSDYCETRDRNVENVDTQLREWFGPEAGDLSDFPASVKVCLVSANFSKEITTTALWLREQGVDLKCVRFKPYRVGDELVAEIEQVIPPPDTDELIVAPGLKQRSAKKATPNIRLDDVYAEMRSGDERRIAKDLQTWLEDSGARVFTTSNGFAPEFPMGDFNLYPLKVRKDGKVVVWFNYLRNRRPFESTEKRRELWGRLSSIPGVQLREGSSPREQFAGLPSFPLEVLKPDESLQKFKNAIEWAVSEARSALSPSDNASRPDVSYGPIDRA